MAAAKRISASGIASLVLLLGGLGFGEYILFVKAHGSSVRGGGPQTWLFEYDLRQRQLVEKLRVDPLSLPSDCR